MSSAATDHPTAPPKSTTGLAVAVTLVIALAGLAIILVFSFSTNNTPMSIDGDSAVEAETPGQE